MASGKSDKRRNPRFYFTLKRGISTRLIRCGQVSVPIQAFLMSLSRGGVSLALDRQYLGHIQPGDLFDLISSEEEEPMNFLNGTQIEIKYIQDHHIYVNISCGGQFTRIPDDKGNRIQTWIQRHLHRNSRDN